ncbi:MAG: hypothetical protein JSS87_05930 [Acidobacteria bacterium]|nr:hypothetical protein [Acidobacteriota bacterium]
MWPKVIAQLWELLPHATRLVPVAQKYFEQRAGGEAEVLAPLQSAVSSISGSNEAIVRQLQEQAQLLTNLTAEVRDLGSANAALSSQLDAVRNAASSASLWAKFATGLSLVAVVLTVILLLKH